MAKPTVRACAEGGCWSAMPLNGPAKCATHAPKPAAPLAFAPDPEMAKRLAAKNAERAKAAKARADHLRRLEREPEETQAFMARLQATGAVPKEA